MIRLTVKRLFSFLIFLLVLYAGIGSQEVGGGFSDAPEVPGSEADVPAPQPLPRSFGSMVLGISLEQAKEDLQTDSLFSYRGDPDISFSPVDSQPIIRADGLAYLDAGIFQFHEDALYSITLQIDPEQLDYFTMYSTLTAKYGDPDYLDPSAELLGAKRCPHDSGKAGDGEISGYGCFYRHPRGRGSTGERERPVQGNLSG
jgi:hypothetical protein